MTLAESLASELAAAVVKDPGASPRTKDLARAVLALQGPSARRTPNPFVQGRVRGHADSCPMEDPESIAPCNCSDREDDL